MCVCTLKYVLQIFLKNDQLYNFTFVSLSQFISRHFHFISPIMAAANHCKFSEFTISATPQPGKPALLLFSHVQLCVLFQESSSEPCQLVEASSMPNLNLVSLTYSSSAPFLSPLGTGTAFRINVFIMAILAQHELLGNV